MRNSGWTGVIHLVLRTSGWGWGYALGVVTTFVLARSYVLTYN